MVYMDGHEVAFVSTIGGTLLLIHRTLPRGWIRGFIHREPVAALSCAWALASITLPLIVPRIRHALKLPTDQYNVYHGMHYAPKFK